MGGDTGVMSPGRWREPCRKFIDVVTRSTPQVGEGGYHGSFFSFFTSGRICVVASDLFTYGDGDLASTIFATVQEAEIPNEIKH